MTWRIVEVASDSKIELKLNYLVVRNTSGIKKVFIPEIAVLILESTAISMTSALLCELVKHKIKVIFCDEKRLPYGELQPYYGSNDSVKKLRNQNQWNEEIKGVIWQVIIRDKILKQRDVLLRQGITDAASLLTQYIDEVEFYDETNREGHAAKVYFNALFGLDFARREDNAINSALNYGYSVLLSVFSREISISGYSTMIGIFHDNSFNSFNLASDLMEPFRPIIDENVRLWYFDEFDTIVKRKIVDLLNSIVYIDGRQNYLINAIRIYVQSFFDAIENNDQSRLKVYEVEIHESDGIL